MQLPPLGLYIHLPWCERKCPYCDFNSHEIKTIPQDEYIRALLKDLRSDLPLLQHRTVDTLFIGGGTPSLFSPAAIGMLLTQIAELVPLSPTLEATMEANPGGAEADKFCQYSREFMTSLLPRDEIFLTLLPPEARALIGQVGTDTAPARRMLEELGFT